MELSMRMVRQKEIRNVSIKKVLFYFEYFAHNI